MKSVVSILLVLALIFPFPLCAQTIYRIKKGQKAPDDGYLYDNFAQARALVQKDIDIERERLKWQKKLDKQRVNLTLTASIARIDAEAEKKRRVETNKVKDDRIQKLELDLLEEKDRVNPLVWYALGVGSGLLIVFGSALVWAKIAESQKP